MTGLGVSMKWAPPCSAIRTSSLRSFMPAQMARNRSSKIMRPYISPDRVRNWSGACKRDGRLGGNATL
jgi:hypothetical protein